MGRGPQHPQEVRLQIRVPQPGLGPGIYIQDVPQKKRASMSWADMSMVTDSGQKKGEFHTNTDLELRDIFVGIESLYTDELRPYGRILRKRLAEHAESRGEPNIDINIERVRAQCEASTELVVQTEDASEWSVVIAGRPYFFADVYSPVDVYPATLWECAAVYLQSLPDEDSKLPGGRYACAQALKSRDLAFLSDRTLGQVSHIVQLAISQKKMLGYSNGVIMPYCRSQSMIKDKCAERRAPCLAGATSDVVLPEGDSGTKQTSTGMPLATWPVARALLHEILKDACKAEKSEVPISNVKRIFRSRFQVDLSETALGHSKLSELLQDKAMQDICSVQMKGRGYVVVPVPHMPPAEHPVMSSTKAVETFRKEEGSPQSPCRERCIGSNVRHTFIHFSSPTCAKRRVKSLPRDFRSNKDSLETLSTNLTSQRDLKGCNNSDLETSVGDVSCNVSESSEDDQRGLALSPVDSSETRLYLSGMRHPDVAAAWRRPPSVRRHERRQDYCCRTPSPSPPPVNSCLFSQALPTFAGFMPMPCVFVGPAPRALCLAEFV